RSGSPRPPRWRARLRTLPGTCAGRSWMPPLPVSRHEREPPSGAERSVTAPVGLPPWSGADRPPSRAWPSLVQPDVVEARALRLLVEALDLAGRGPEPVEIPVANRRDLLVEEARLLLPEGEQLLGIGLPGELPIDGLDLLVAGPPRPRAREEGEGGR